MISKQIHSIIQQDLLAITARNIPWQKLSGSRVVVTGAGGFLGGYLVRTLLSLHRIGKVSEPLQVVALARNIARAKQQFLDFSQDSQLSFMECDLNDYAIPGLGDVHYIIHAASQASPRFYSADPIGTFLPNVMGTIGLLEMLRQSANPRGFMFVSSSEIYGSVNSDKNLKESDYGVVDPTELRSCYAEGKRAGETACIAWHSQYNIPTWSVRPFHTYGPGLKAEDGRVFADFSYNIIRNENIEMNSNGMASRAFCYVSDAIAGFFTVMLLGQPGSAYNVANPSGEMSILSLAEMLVNLYPEKNLEVRKNLDAKNLDYLPSPYSRLIPDVSKLESLGWRADVLPADGFRRMIEALQ